MFNIVDVRNAVRAYNRVSKVLEEEQEVFNPTHVDVKPTVTKEYKALPKRSKMQLAILRESNYSVNEDKVRQPGWNFDEYLKEAQMTFKDRVKRDISNISKLLKSQDEYSTNIENRISKLEHKIDKLVTKLSEIDEDKISNLIVSQLQAFIEEQNNSMDTQPAQDDMINNIDLTKAKPAKTTKSKH